MEKWKRVQILTILIILVSLFVLIWLSENWIIKALVFVVIISLLLWKWMDRKIEIIKNKESKAEDEIKCIEALNHYRHDWLNYLQVLFGYIKLKKYDNLECYVDKIKGKLERESMIAKLGIPSLILYFITFHPGNQGLELKFNIESGLQLSELPVNRDEISEIAIELFESLLSKAKTSNEKLNQLVIHIHSQTGAVVLSFEYEGNLMADAFDSEVQELKLKKQLRFRSEVSDMKALVEIVVPYYA